MTQPTLLSSCCNATVKLRGGVTVLTYYECTKCGKPSSINASDEKNCEANDLQYLSHPPQLKCKKCGKFWFQKDPTPICSIVPTVNASAVEEIEALLKKEFHHFTQKINTRFLNQLARFITTHASTLSDSTLREIVFKGKELLKETQIFEDGVPVDTYGYVETYNNGVNDTLDIIRQYIGK